MTVFHKVLQRAPSSGAAALRASESIDRTVRSASGSRCSRSCHTRHQAAGLSLLLAAVLSLAMSPSAHAADTTPAAQLQRFSSQAGTAPSATRGQAFFTTTHGGRWSCSSCHGPTPLTDGRHASTGKAIKPLAPAANALAFTDSARVDKWFRRNCNDVLSRACSDGEKADVLAFLIGLKP
jgi:cytochrome c peroxidase